MDLDSAENLVEGHLSVAAYSVVDLTVAVVVAENLVEGHLFVAACSVVELTVPVVVAVFAAAAFQEFVTLVVRLDGSEGIPMALQVSALVVETASHYDAPKRHFQVELQLHSLERPMLLSTPIYYPIRLPMASKGRIL